MTYADQVYVMERGVWSKVVKPSEVFQDVALEKVQLGAKINSLL